MPRPGASTQNHQKYLQPIDLLIYYRLSERALKNEAKPVKLTPINLTG
jgi:hypothetical protein